MITALTLAAAGVDPSSDIFAAILGGGGVTGAVLIMVSLGIGLHSNDAYKQVIAERDRVLQENQQLKMLMNGQVVPALAKNVDVIEASSNKEQALMDRLDSIALRLESHAKES